MPANERPGIRVRLEIAPPVGRRHPLPMPVIGNLLFTRRIPRLAKILPRDSSGRSIMAATLPDRPGRTLVGERRHSLCDAQTIEGTKLSLERSLRRPAHLHRH